MTNQATTAEAICFTGASSTPQTSHRWLGHSDEELGTLGAATDAIEGITKRAEGVLYMVQGLYNGRNEEPVMPADALHNALESVIMDMQDIRAVLDVYFDATRKNAPAS